MGRSTLQGVMDGEELERSIRDLTGYLPMLKSVSVVPVGLTKYREGLYPMTPLQRGCERSDPGDP